MKICTLIFFSIIVIVATVWLHFIYPSIPSEFYQGFSVEAIGIVLEVGIIYLLVDWLLDRKRRSLREPVMAKLQKLVTNNFAYSISSLSQIVDALSKYERGALDKVDQLTLGSSEELEVLLSKLHKLLAHASSHIPVDAYIQLLDFSEYMQDIIAIIKNVEMTGFPLDENGHPRAYLGLRHILISKKSLTESMKIRDWFENQTKKPAIAYRFSPNETTPDSIERLIEEIDKINSMSTL
ncbi:hypothetical protein [Pseudidiomarina sediminum]|uniref:hypothetical protein n=1 Tax=Pseudidiomarina sediminum TaxID=431675 RepID=UPI001C93D48C|nr:hypothetical protein [Pseudidiomarina sediminum]MBY6064310.1 hypothetical protein [Pseudidiomarina sediminum]